MLIEIDPVDAAIVHSILMTHAEMQDNRAVKSMELQSRLQRDEPGETAMIDTLAAQVTDFEEDTEELRRIAQMFPNLV